MLYLNVYEFSHHFNLDTVYTTMLLVLDSGIGTCRHRIKANVQKYTEMYLA